MDFSRFSHDDFEVQGWVNAALEAYKDNQSPLDAHASSLVMKLQLFILEVNQGLEETSCNMLQSLPRVLRDMDAVRMEATLLRQQMQVVKDDIKKVERDTAVSMQTLVELDAIKGRMEGSLLALQEADNWTTLAADVQHVFASQDTHKIAEKLAGMEQSLHVLHDVPDFEERRKFLEGLKDKFEAILSPRLVAVFDTHATVETAEYVKMCLAIGRAAQLRNYYIACHKGVILDHWMQLQSSSPSLLQALSTFYDELLTKWHVEGVWCQQVGLQPVLVLSLLFCQALDSLSPSLSQCLHDAVKTTPTSSTPTSTSLSSLVELRQVSFKFLSGLERAVGTEEDLEGGRVELLALVECVHRPYCQLLVHYSAMETHLLKQQLQTVNLSVLGGLEEGGVTMCDSVSWVLQYAGEAVERCFLLTGGWGCHALVKALQALFSQYTSTLSSNMHQLHRGCGLANKGGTLQQSGSGLCAGEEWSTLQHVFQLIQLCGDVLLRSYALCEQLHTALVQASAQLQSPASLSAPFRSYDYLAVYHPEERTSTMQLLHNLHTSNAGDAQSVLPDSLWDQLQALNEQAHSFAFDIIFNPLKQKLERVPHLQVWCSGAMSPLDSPRALTSEGLPQFSLSPLPYITEIGDYLLTLPRQLEPFTSQDSPALTHALQRGKLPFSDSLEERRVSVSEEGEPHPSDEWLGAVARGTMETYAKQILLISSLPPAAASQLTTDIAYLSNVLTALGQMPSQQLIQLETLLKPMEQSEFEELKNSTPLHFTVSKLRTWQ